MRFITQVSRAKFKQSVVSAEKWVLWENSIGWVGSCLLSFINKKRMREMGT